MDDKKQFRHHDAEYAADKAFIDAIGDRVPTDEEWRECRKIWSRTFDRLFSLGLIADENRNKN